MSIRLGLSAIVLVLTGCGSSTVTKANFEKLKPSMTLAEIEGILGKATKGGEKPEAKGKEGAIQFPFTMYKWGDDRKYITVGFDDGGKAAVIWEKGVLEN
jgi:hypothetical protein